MVEVPVTPESSARSGPVVIGAAGHREAAGCRNCRRVSAALSGSPGCGGSGRVESGAPAGVAGAGW